MIKASTISLSPILSVHNLPTLGTHTFEYPDFKIGNVSYFVRLLFQFYPFMRTHHHISINARMQGSNALNNGMINIRNASICPLLFRVHLYFHWQLYALLSSNDVCSSPCNCFLLLCNDGKNSNGTQSSVSHIQVRFSVLPYLHHPSSVPQITVAPPSVSSIYPVPFSV